MAHKRKYHRGERITSIEELLEQSIVYLGTADIRTKSIQWIKCMQLNTILKCMEKPGIYKAVLGDGPDMPAGIPEEQIDGQMNYFEEENDERS